MEEFKKKIQIFETLVSPSILFGAEIWSRYKEENIETIRNKYIKWILGIEKNTPAYIWEMECGQWSWTNNNHGKKLKLLINMYKMLEDRWPKVCLREVLKKAEIINLRTGCKKLIKFS